MSNSNGNGNGKDLFGLLINDIEELKATTRAHSLRLDSLSETMAQTARTMALIAKEMARESSRVRDHQRLYGRLAKTLVAFKESSDHRFQRLESRVRRLEHGGVRH